MAGTQGMHRREERKEVTLCTAPTRRGPLLAGEKARFCSEWTILQRGTFPGKRELMNQYREPVSAWNSIWASFRCPDLHTWNPALFYRRFPGCHAGLLKAASGEEPNGWERMDAEEEKKGRCHFPLKSNHRAPRASVLISGVENSEKIKLINFSLLCLIFHQLRSSNSS